MDWIVESDWLAANRDTVRIVDVRDSWEFDGIGHLPGAVNIPFDRFRSVEGDVGMLPGAEHWAELLGEAGITADDRIVAYDDTHGVFAARFLVTALLYGHQELALLNGDYSRWQRSYETTTEPTGVESASYTVEKPTDSPLIDIDAVAAAAEDPTAVVVDTRDRTEYDDGHIPGAVNLDWRDLVDPETRGLLSEAELRERLAANGIEPDRRIVLYCNTARRISHTFIVLSHLGFDDVAFYEGSLTEWLRDGRPLEGERADELTVEDVA